MFMGLNYAHRQVFTYRSCRPLVVTTEGCRLISREQTGSVAAGAHAQPPPDFFCMCLDRALADIELTRYFLGLVLLGNQPQDFLLTPRQRLDTCLVHPALLSAAKA